MTKNSSGQLLAWDFDNRLKAIFVPSGSGGIAGTHTYDYDALGRRVIKGGIVVSPVIYTYAGNQVIAEYKVAGGITTVLRKYVYASYIDEPIVMIDRTAAGSVGAGTDELFYYHCNSQYSVVALTNAGGAVQERYAYSAYGEPVFLNAAGTPLAVQQSTVGNEYTYTGRRHDPETGLYHFRDRYFAWKEGRFVNRDPILYRGSKWNLYGGYFVPGGVDPLGLEPNGNGFDIDDPSTYHNAMLPPINNPAYDRADQLAYDTNFPPAVMFALELPANVVYGPITKPWLAIEDSVTVYDNTSHMGAWERGYTVLGMYGANLTGVRGVSDAFNKFDAVDGHRQSYLERWYDGLDGGLTLGGLGYGGMRVGYRGSKLQCKFERNPCFPPGTPVLMADGTTKAIEKVKEGDLVLADDPEDKEKPKVYKVLARSKNWTKRLIHFFVDEDGDDKSDAHFKATGKHPIWTTKRGWQFAVDLKPGDKLLTDTLTKVTVLKVTEEKTVVDTYNLSIAGVHTFYVEVDGVAVLVHNESIHPGSVPGGTWTFDPVKDLDLRGKSGFELALEEAFDRTGFPRREFSPHSWAPDANGKTMPNDWRHPSGAKVNIDDPRIVPFRDGPGDPHIGYETGTKRKAGGRRGHIIVDDVPVTRPMKGYPCP